MPMAQENWYGSEDFDEPDTVFCPICGDGFTSVEQVFDHQREDH